MPLPIEFGAQVRAYGLRHLLLVPMTVKVELVGMLTVTRGQNSPAFDPAAVRLARTVADRLAAAVENERLHTRERQRAAAEERDRLARDLHVKLARGGCC